MATRKLSPSLFSAKAGIAESEGSTQYLHFRTCIRRDRNRYAFVCESQPLLTLMTHGLPKRCPLCRQDAPIGREIQSKDSRGKVVGWRETCIGNPLPSESSGGK
jgi:hypothetical protein